MRRTDRFTRFKQGGGIVKWLAAAFIPIDETDEQGGGPHPRVKSFQNLKVLGNKARFEDEVLRRVSGDGKLWGQDQFRAGIGKAIVSAHDQLKIAAQIPNRRIELSKTDLHAWINTNPIETLMRCMSTRLVASKPAFSAMYQSSAPLP